MGLTKKSPELVVGSEKLRNYLLSEEFEQYREEAQGNSCPCLVVQLGIGTGKRGYTSCRGLSCSDCTCQMKKDGYSLETALRRLLEQNTGDER